MVSTNLGGSHPLPFHFLKSLHFVDKRPYIPSRLDIPPSRTTDPRMVPLMFPGSWQLHRRRDLQWSGRTEGPFNNSSPNWAQIGLCESLLWPNGIVSLHCYNSRIDWRTPRPTVPVVSLHSTASDKFPCSWCSESGDCSHAWVSTTCLTIQDGYPLAWKQTDPPEAKSTLIDTSQAEPSPHWVWVASMSTGARVNHRLWNCHHDTLRSTSGNSALVGASHPGIGASQVAQATSLSWGGHSLFNE